MSSISHMFNFKIEPPFWWANMKDTSLQLMVYGDRISDYEVKISNPTIFVLNIVRFDSPNYLDIYLDISHAAPCTFEIAFRKKDGTDEFKVDYELRKRAENQDDLVSFDSSDTLYLIMVDRFAKGSDVNYGTLEIPKKERSEEEEEEETKDEKDKEETKDEKEDVFNDPNFPSIKTPYLVDRNNPDLRHGGDIKGIIQHLDYISDLGVTAIWLTPIFTNDMKGGSYHGYASTDYYSVDPRFGTNEDLCNLVEIAHKKKIKIIMDQVFNHCGSNHIWSKDIPSRDWFNFPDKKVQTTHEKELLFSPYASELDLAEFNDGFFVETMPDLNQRNPHLKKYLIQNSIWWIEYTRINGIRQDTFPYADQKMMNEWIEKVNEEYPKFNIVGECWIENTLGSSMWQKGNIISPLKSNLKTVMDFSFTKIIHDATHKETNFEQGYSQLFKLLNYDFVYPNIRGVLRFLDNHDTDRFLNQKPKDINGFKHGITVLLTLPGIPQLFYGTEIMMYGSKEITDGNVRKDFPGGWNTDKINCFEESGRTPMQNEAFNFIKKLLNWRKGSKIISKGSMKHFRVYEGVYVYVRKYKEKSILIILNGTEKSVKLPLERYQEVIGNHAKATDVITNKIVDFKSPILLLKPREINILEF